MRKLTYKNGPNDFVAIAYIQKMDKGEFLRSMCKVKKTKVSLYTKNYRDVRWSVGALYTYVIIIIAFALVECKVNIKVSVNIAQYFVVFLCC